MKNSGQIGVIHLVTWGLTITTLIGGIFWAKVSAIDSNFENYKTKASDERVQTASAISSMQTDISNIKEIVNRIDRKLK